MVLCSESKGETEKGGKAWLYVQKFSGKREGGKLAMGKSEFLIFKLRSP